MPINTYPIWRITLNIPFSVHRGVFEVRKVYKRIHMPKPLYDEIELFVSKADSPYRTVSELCREAGRMLIEHYGLVGRFGKKEG